VRILVADDVTLSRTVVSEILMEAGHQVIEAADGDSARAILDAEDPPQLVILDWVMPGLDGPALCRLLRSDPDRAYVYVIMLTAKGGISDLETAMASGADDYLVKPVDPRELRARVGRATDMLARLDELRATREALRAQSIRDPLTGLLNRGEIVKSLERELSFAKRQGIAVSALVLDIDHFKKVNDSYGHLSGDKVLCDVAELLRGATRTYDILGRYGGEEFLVVLPGCGVDTVVVAAERYRTQIEEHTLELRNEIVSVTVSIGVASSDPTAHVSASELFEAADEALYAAKRNGRNRVEVAQSVFATSIDNKGREL